MGALEVAGFGHQPHLLDERVPEAGHIEQGHGLGVQADLPQVHDFEQFLQGARAAGQGDERVGQSSAIRALRACMLATISSLVKP